MKYIHIIKFLLKHDLTHLKECWQAEFTRKKKVSVYRVLKSYIRTDTAIKKYLFWWRLAHEMFMYGNEKQKKIANKIQKKLIYKFKIDIHLAAKIGKNFNIVHDVGIVITDIAIIGDNVSIRQNTTIGRKTSFKNIDYKKMNHFIKIGNNVHIGANSCIIGDKLTIGSNVIIGAMSFINKDIPDNCTVYTKKTNTIINEFLEDWL